MLRFIQSRKVVVVKSTIQINLSLKLRNLMDNEKDFTVSKYAEEAYLHKMKHLIKAGNLRKNSKILNVPQREAEKLRLKLECTKHMDTRDYTKPQREKNSFTYSGQMSFGIRKTRKSQDKYNGIQSTAPPKEAGTPPRISSYREHLMNRQPEPNEKPQTSGKFHLDLPLSECATIEKENIDNTTSVLVDQNQKLAKRVGELQTQCQNMSHKLGFYKAKYAQEISRLGQERDEQAKQTIYLQKLVYYYKTLARRLNKKLIDNGVEDYTLTNTSVYITNETQEILNI